MIERYDFGRIVIDGKTYTSDVVMNRDKIDSNWWRKEGHELHVEDIKTVLDRDRPEVLIIGTGFFGRMMVLPETKDFARLKGIELMVEPTPRAVETYNELYQKRKVTAALHLTC